MAGNIYPKPASLVEVAGSGVIKFGQDGVTATRIAEVDTGEALAAVQFLMGYVGVDLAGNEVKYGADEWPGIPRLKCASVNITPHGAMSDTDWDFGPNYAKWRLEIAYEIPQWEQDDASDGPEDITYLIQQLDYSCEVLTVPMKVGSSGTPLADRPTVQRNIRLPLITYTMTLPKVKKPKWDKYQEYIGTVNTLTMFGGLESTVLFDGPAADRTVTLLGDRAWKVVLKFIYNTHGWNNTLNPNTLVWEDARDIDAGSDPPYESNNLLELLR